MIQTLNKFEDKLKEKEQKLETISKLINLENSQEQIKKLLKDENIKSDDVLSEKYQSDLEKLKSKLDKTNEILRQTKNDLQKKEYEYAELQTKLDEETFKLTVASGSLQEETKQIIKEKDEELEKIKNNWRISDIKLQEQIKFLKNKNNELKNQLNEERVKYAASVSQVKERSKKQMEEAVDLIYDEQSQRLDAMANRIRKVQRALKRKTEEADEKEEQLKTHEKLVESQANQTSELQFSQMQSEKKVYELNNVVNQLTEEVNLLENKINNLEVDKKVLEMQLSSAQEKTKQQESYYNSQLQVAKFSAMQELPTKFEKAKEEFQEEFTKFLRDICTKFPEYVDFSSPIDKNSILMMIRKISDKVKVAEKDLDKLADLEKQNREIRVVVGAARSTRTIDAVQEFAANAKLMKQKLENIH
ncbi:hypothetical protein TVAG_457360 [Trichomonas vaginalis G3]|uniref:Uncharacterized protein n=1 Tax=Trichomonas vaginalis (strain ATCC PRA-98 / G3) TaxID=412133 RepID=A2DC60_TRIV3|nr:hypothetical protein TVAGG3_0263050 [Trichomonas vaginalis G3]EAY22101.1 hypothetical protein TVAG_457360 [Trichomonas vaginalis G3]KAI5525256.1 hypothetical protein TVAGG3_0263050 [Trichomonas vaginalis G3]|eukprot:XP_001583087.1 hypothetical protein [Trichomonas vaginalis G3]